MKVTGLVLDAIAFFDRNPLRRAVRAARRILDQLDPPSSTAAILAAEGQRVMCEADAAGDHSASPRRLIARRLLVLASAQRPASTDREARHA